MKIYAERENMDDIIAATAAVCASDECAESIINLKVEFFSGTKKIFNRKIKTGVAAAGKP